MVDKIKKILMVGLFSVTSSAYSMETLIDFEDQVNKYENFSEVTIQNVTFSLPETSGYFVDVFDYEGSLGTGLALNGLEELTFSFENVVSSFSLEFLSTNYTWQLTAFDVFNELIGSALVPENNGVGSLSSLNDNISYATLTRGDSIPQSVIIDGEVFVLVDDGLASSTLIIDNFRYTEVSPVPEPSTYALMLGGLGLVGFMAYRRKKVLS
ncbi:MAG: PEP-CTERM sorting domain-containing protein [Thiomicrorhabdus sp.]|nr:PEP-CTERM sorting domain-containing protein [Thiomicrorhabdus sp.]